MSESKYMTVEDACEFLGRTPQTLRTWCRAGLLKTYSLPMGRGLYYLRADIMGLIKPKETNK